MIKKSDLIFLLFVLLFQSVKAQTTADSTLLNKEFLSIEEALKKPENVFRLNLSNQNMSSLRKVKCSVFGCEISKTPSNFRSF